MQRMPMVPPELRVGAFERRVSVGLWLLDTVHKYPPSVPLLLLRLPLDDDARREGDSVPVPVRLLRLVVLRRVLGFCAVVSG